jgi:hypothetical protein
MLLDIAYLRREIDKDAHPLVARDVKRDACKSNSIPKRQSQGATRNGLLQTDHTRLQPGNETWLPLQVNNSTSGISARKLIRSLESVWCKNTTGKWNVTPIKTMYFDVYNLRGELDTVAGHDVRRMQLGIEKLTEGYSIPPISVGILIRTLKITS